MSRHDDFTSEEPMLAAPPSRWEQLRAIALTLGGPLMCEGATQVVPGEGNARAELVLIGEAPGEQEDRQGRPFVGRSGKLLDQLLATAGLDRRDLWITNTVKCRPVTNEDGHLRNRAPKTSEIKAWTPVLKQELTLLRPRLLVGLGAVAGKALVDPDFKITRQRGQWHHDRLLGLEVLVTWHPAYLLRQQGESYQARMAEALSDFEAVAARLRSLEG